MIETTQVKNTLLHFVNLLISNWVASINTIFVDKAFLIKSTRKLNKTNDIVCELEKIEKNEFLNIFDCNCTCTCNVSTILID